VSEYISDPDHAVEWTWKIQSINEAPDISSLFTSTKTKSESTKFLPVKTN